jgi:steroid delta-isomerase
VRGFVRITVIRPSALLTWCTSAEVWTKYSTRTNRSYSVPVVAELDLLALLERHVELFNDAVSSQDFGPLLATFAIHAVMSFDDIPIGPFQGIAEISKAYAANTLDDTIALIDMEEIGSDAVRSSFEWDAGGTGEMFIRWRDDEVVELRIAVSLD